MFLASALREMPALVTFSRLELLGGCGAADACAQGSKAGIGGWWSWQAKPAGPHEIMWFHLEIGPQDFPHFSLSETAKLDIAFYECFAQVVLLKGFLCFCLRLF